MSASGNLPRRYNEDEVGELLRRATELHQEESTPGARDGTGMTLAELQEIAAEAGIDPRHIQRAAAQIDYPTESTFGNKLAGTPLTISVERVVPGELAEADLSQIVPEIQRISTGHGNATMVGRTLTWSSETSQRQRTLQVTVSTQNGETLIRAEERLHGLAGALYGGLVGGAGGGIGFGIGLPLGIEVFGSAAFAVAFPLVIVAACYAIARTVMKKTGEDRRRALNGLVDHIAGKVVQAPSAQLDRGQAGALGAGSDSAD